MWIRLSSSLRDACRGSPLAPSRAVHTPSSRTLPCLPFSPFASPPHASFPTREALRWRSGEPARPRFVYLSAWFCPFAHRATLALEHHSAHLSWDWEEALGWEKRPSSVGEESDGRVVDWYYHWKSPKLIEANPSALVPTLIDESGRSVYESLVCMEFIDEVASQQESWPTSLHAPARAIPPRNCLRNREAHSNCCRWIPWIVRVVVFGLTS